MLSWVILCFIHPSTQTSSLGGFAGFHTMSALTSSFAMFLIITATGGRYEKMTVKKLLVPMWLILEEDTLIN